MMTKIPLVVYRVTLLDLFSLYTKALLQGGKSLKDLAPLKPTMKNKKNTKGDK